MPLELREEADSGFLLLFFSSVAEAASSLALGLDDLNMGLACLPSSMGPAARPITMPPTVSKQPRRAPETGSVGSRFASLAMLWWLVSITVEDDVCRRSLTASVLLAGEGPLWLAPLLRASIVADLAFLLSMLPRGRGGYCMFVHRQGLRLSGVL